MSIGGSVDYMVPSYSSSPIFIFRRFFKPYKASVKSFLCFDSASVGACDVPSELIVATDGSVVGSHANP